MTILLCAVIAALLGGLGPEILARLPEPLEPDPGKPLYADLGRRAGLRWWLALGSGMLAAFAGWAIGEPRLLPVWVLLAAFTPLLAHIDAATHLLPFYIVAPLYVASWLAVGISALLMSDPQVLWHALVGNLALFGSYFVVGLVGPMGYGDVRLSAVLGVALGPLGLQPAFCGVLFGLVLGALFGLLFLIAGRATSKTPIAFGPYLLLGAFGALLV